MAAIINPSLFSWNDVEVRSDLDRFYLVRDNLPDEKIVMELEDRRGNGRDDCPVCAMWNAIISGVVFQHMSIESLIRELSRNSALMEALPDFGRHLGYDGKSINSYSTGHKSRDTGETSDVDADWGKHETKGIDSKTGKPWTKIKSWFGYGLHVIADTKHEIPVAVNVTPASASEHTELRSMIKETFEETPELGDRCDDFAADRGLDSGKTKTLLLDEYNIRLVIDVRELWNQEKSEPGYDPEKPITRSLYPDPVLILLYTLKRGQFIVFVLRQENNGTCHFMVLKQTVIP